MQFFLFHGYMNMANILTFGGLVAATSAFFLAFIGKPDLAIICLILAGISDLFDGMVARKLNLGTKERELGVQLDSLIDMVSFGITPGIIALSLGLTGIVDWALYAFFACCAAMRLAYFNVHTADATVVIKRYTGLPVTYAALIFPLGFICHGTLPDYLSNALIRAAFLLVSLLYISRFDLPKPRGVWYIIFPLIAIATTAYWLYRHATS